MGKKNKNQSKNDESANPIKACRMVILEDWRKKRKLKEKDKKKFNVGWNIDISTAGVAPLTEWENKRERERRIHKSLHWGNRAVLFYIFRGNRVYCLYTYICVYCIRFILVYKTWYVSPATHRYIYVQYYQTRIEGCWFEGNKFCCTQLMHDT